MIHGSDFMDTSQGDIEVHVFDFRHFTRDEGGVASGSIDGGCFGELFGERDEDFADEASVADDCSDLHGVFSGLTNGAFGLGEVDLGKEGGPLMKVVAECSEAGGDDPSEIGSSLAGGDDIEGHGGAKVDHDGGVGERDQGGGIGESVGANAGGIGVIDGDGELAVAADLMGGDSFVLQSGSEELGLLRDYGADGRARGLFLERGLAKNLANGLGGKLVSGHDGSPIEENALVREGELGAGIGVVDEEVDKQEIGEREQGAKKKRPVARSLLVV